MPETPPDSSTPAFARSPVPPRRPVPLRLAGGLARLVLGLCLIVLLLVLGGLLAIRTDWFRARVRELALERLAAAVQGQVQVGRLEGDLLRGVQLEDVSITGPRGEPFVRARRLSVEYELGGFLSRKILLGDVRLEDPRISLVQDSTGQWNYLRILPFLRGSEKPGGPGWGSVIRVEALQVVNGTLSVIDEGEARAFGPLGMGPEIVSLNGRIGLDISSAGGDRKRVSAENLSFRLLRPGLEVAELDADGAFTPEGVEIDRFHLRTKASDLSGSGTIRNLAAPVFDLTFRAAPLDLAEASRFVPRVPFNEGTVRGEVGLSGPSDDLELSLRDFALQTPRSRIAGQGTLTTERGPRVSADLRLDPLDPSDARVFWSGFPLDHPVTGRVHLEGNDAKMEVQADLAFASTRARVTGTVGFSGRAPEYDLRIGVQGLDLEDVFHAPAWASSFSGSFVLQGTGLGTSARARFAGEVRDSRILFYELRTGSFEGRFRPGGYDVAGFRIQLPSTTVEGTGVMPYDETLDFELRGTSRNLRDFYPSIGPTPARLFQAQGRLHGPYKGLELTLNATADSLSWNGLVADSFSGNAAFIDLGQPTVRIAMAGTGRGVTYLDRLPFESADFQAGFEGDTMGVNVSMRMDSVRIGEGHLNVDLSGATARVVLDRGTLHMGDQDYVIQEPSGFVYQAGLFTFHEFAVAHDGERAAIDGALRLDGAQDFRFELDGVSLDDLQFLAGVPPVATGVFNGSGTVGGTDEAPVIRGRFDLSEGRIGRLKIHRLEGRVDYADRSLGLDVNLAPQTSGADSVDPGSIELTGKLPVELAFGEVPRRIPDGPLDLSVQSRGLSLAFLQAFARGPVQASGPLDVRLRLGGRPSAPQLSGEISLSEGRVGKFAIHRFGGSLDYADRRLRFDLSLQPETKTADRLGNPGTLTARGTFPLDLSFGRSASRVPELPIDVTVASDNLSLGLLRSLSPGLGDASGPVQVDLRLTGTPSAPRYEGEISLRDGTLRAAEDGPTYTGVGGSVRFDNDQITFENVRASSSSGDASLAGSIAVRELTLGDIRAKLQANRFTLVDADGKQLLVDADIDLGGTTHAPSVTGRVNVDQAVWPLPERTEKDVIDLDEAILYVRAPGDTVPPSPPPDVWRQTSLDLDVNVEDDAILKSDQALITLEGDLSIEKQRDRDLPTMAGTLNVVNGFYSEFGNRFQVQEGEVFFYGTPDLNPGLHIVATTTVRNTTNDQEVEVTLTLGGTVEGPTLELSSAPTFEKSEIFSLLLFGSPSPDLTQRSEFESTVTRVATSQAALPLQRALAAELGLDLLEIQPSFGSAGGAFRAGKYVASDVFVTYTQTTGPFEESQFGIQYRLTRRWTLETQAGTRQFGADIFYEFQY